EYPAVQRYRLDRAPLRQAARRLRVVVRVARHPGEVERGVRLDEGQHRRAVVEQGPLARDRYLVTDHVREVLARPFSGVGDPGAAEHVVAGNPEAAAGT